MKALSSSDFNYTRVTDVMIDIETMALGPDAAIVQVGAVGFDVLTGYVDDYSHSLMAEVTEESCHDYGGITDPETVRWWQKQGGFRYQLRPGNIDLALCALNKWFSVRPHVQRVWANHIAFDLACLEFYYRRTGYRIPWTHRMPSDMPTVTNLAESLNWARPNIRKATHNPVEDCRDQVKVLTSACHHVGYLS